VSEPAKLRVVYCDVDANEFVQLGESPNLPKTLARQMFDDLPVEPEGLIIVDFMINPWTIDQDKLISRRTCEDVLEAPFDELLRTARESFSEFRESKPAG
jgi:hypothetical protein